MTPLERFDAWRVANQPLLHGFFVPAYGLELLKSEIQKMRVWVQVKKPNYRKWDRFMVNWMNRCDDVIIKAVYNRAAVEKAVENSKRRWTGKSEFEDISNTPIDRPLDNS